MKGTVYILLTLAWAAPTLAGVSPDMFERMGSAPVEEIRSFAAEGSSVCLLLENVVALANTAEPGTLMSMHAVTPLQQSYNDCFLKDRRLCFYSRAGALGVAELAADSLVVLNEQSMGDTIISVAALGRYLYLANGFSGISIIDADSEGRLRSVGRADHGAYYSRLQVYDTLLLAVDRLNGLDVYRIYDSVLVYLRTLSANWPITDFARVDDIVLTCYGNDRVDRLRLDGNHERDESPVLFPGRADWLEAFGTSVIVGFGDGLLQSYDPHTEAVLDSFQLAYPGEKLSTTQETNGQRFCYALDSRGKLLKLFSGELSLVKELQLAASPRAMVAVDNGLIISRDGQGLFRLAFESGSTTETLLYETSTGFSALAACDSLLFAAVANSGSVLVYRLSGDLVVPLMEVDMTNPVKQLYVRNHQTREYDIIAISAVGAYAVTVDLRERRSEHRWLTSSRFPVATGYFDDCSLVLASTSGDIDYYCLDCDWPRPFLRGTVSMLSAPRSVAMIDGQYLVVGSHDGSSLYRLSQADYQFEPLGDLPAISSVSELLYEPEGRLLLIATGEKDIRYLDFSDPLRPGAIYSILGSRGVTSVSLFGDRLYAREHNAIVCYQSLPETDHPSRESVIISEPFPNPFNLSTTVDIQLANDIPGGTRIAFEIIDVLGRTIREGEVNEPMPIRRIFWDGADGDGRPVASGVYFLRVRTAESVGIRKMLLVK